MKRNKIFTIIILFTLNLFLFSSCYTKRKGVVPCPHGYNDINIENTDKLITEPA